MHPIVQRAVNLILDQSDPDRVIVFGSYARGAQGPRSDVNLLVVESTVTPREVRSRELASLFASYPVPVEVTVCTPEELADEARQGYTRIAAALRKGVEVYRRATNVTAPQRSSPARS